MTVATNLIESLNGIPRGGLKGKRVMVNRIGALGDCIVMTPFLRWLKREGAEVVMLTSERGRHVLHGLSSIDSFSCYVSDSVPPDLWKRTWRERASENRCDILLDFCGSIESALSPSVSEPLYKMPKNERHARCNVNYYEQMWHFSGASWAVPDLTSADLRPEMVFSRSEVREVEEFLGNGLPDGAKLMVVCWTGSGAAKRYPWMKDAIGEALTRHPNLFCIVVGDQTVDLRALSDETGGRVCSRMTHWNFKKACVAGSLADVVVAPDTGFLHAMGAFQVPKVGILGANTRENLTKHFLNDLSIEANQRTVGCAPCHRLIQDSAVQCETELFPWEGDSKGYAEIAWCLSLGIDPEDVTDRIGRGLMIGNPQAWSRRLVHA